MPQKIYLKILKNGVYLSFLAVFLFWGKLVFPYITSKQIYFNVLIELLFIFWLSFILKYPEWRPRRSLVSGGLLGFFAVLLLSCFLSVDFNLSFWGDAERMLGVFHLLHFLAFYFIIITVFRSWSDWRNLLSLSVLAAVLVSFYGMAQKMGWAKSPWGADRVVSTIGNSAYVGAYAIFNIFFALLLFFTEKEKWRKCLYPPAAFFVFLALIFSGTRGAYLGFFFGLLLSFLLAALLHKNKKIRLYGLAAFLLLFLLAGGIFLGRESDFIKKHEILQRFSDFSLSDATMQTRFISWKAAYLDFPHHPLLGTGYGNFAITFDKYFDPKFYNFTGSETYFDRAHNNLIDIASTTGLLGLASYLFIFAAALYYLIRLWREEKINATIFSLLVGLMAAYFIQNLVVFDSFVTYLSLMIFFGLIHWLKKEKGGAGAEDKSPAKKEFILLAIFSLVALLIVWQYNLKPLRMLMRTIEAQAVLYNDFYEGAEKYREALADKTVLDRDSRDNLIRSLVSLGQNLESLEPEKVNDFVEFAVSLAEENVKNNRKDSLMQLKLAQILSLASLLNKQKFTFYSERALEAIEKSIAASPGRVPIYFYKAQIYAFRGDKEKVKEIMKQTIELNPDYYESYCQFAKYLLYFKEEKDGFSMMDKCLERGGVESLAPASYLSELIKHYQEKKDNKSLLELYTRLTELDPDKAGYYIELAKLYVFFGNKKSAVMMVDRAVEVDGTLKKSADDFIRQLEGMK